MQLEYIEWEDVLSAGSDWKDQAEVDEWCKDVNEAFTVKQCGFVVHETDRYIVLCSHYHSETDIVPAQYGHLQKILKSLILTRKTVKM